MSRMIEKLIFLESPKKLLTLWVMIWNEGVEGTTLWRVLYVEKTLRPRPRFWVAWWTICLGWIIFANLARFERFLGVAFITPINNFAPWQICERMPFCPVRVANASSKSRAPMLNLVLCRQFLPASKYFWCTVVPCVCEDRVEVTRLYDS